MLGLKYVSQKKTTKYNHDTTQNIVYAYKNLLVYRFSLSSALNFGM